MSHTTIETGAEVTGQAPGQVQEAEVAGQVQEAEVAGQVQVPGQVQEAQDFSQDFSQDFCVPKNKVRKITEIHQRRRVIIHAIVYC